MGEVLKFPGTYKGDESHRADRPRLAIAPPLLTNEEQAILDEMSPAEARDYSRDWLAHIAAGLERRRYRKIRETAHHFIQAANVSLEILDHIESHAGFGPLSIRKQAEVEEVARQMPMDMQADLLVANNTDLAWRRRPAFFTANAQQYMPKFHNYVESELPGLKPSH